MCTKNKKKQNVPSACTAEKKFHFEKLAPIDTADIDVYEEAIDFAFENSDIRNIAISGAYGSGKSSLLATYKKKHGDKKFIHISLAHFKPDHEESNEYKLDTNPPDLNKESTEPVEEPQKTCHTEGTDKISESVLEGKILNQLIHQLKEDDIPQTNFRIKKTLSKQQIAWQSIAIIALFVSVIHLTLSYTWINFVSSFTSGCWFRDILELTTTPASFFVSGGVGLSIIAYFIIASVKRQRFRAAIRKLSFQGNDIELFENENDSFFDKYLNEVLYLFENANVDAIVFEDMDRYDMEGIFERLHEVNTLANIRLNSKGKPIIRFFFLLRDDLFISKDRTKFFDYIIPVVPVLDSSNSYDQLIGHMKMNNLDTLFENRFLQGLSLYIDDMRLLKNICNEFLVYYNRLGATEPNPNKMLAIVVYKNLFPKDFSELQINKGFVYAIFAQGKALIEKEEIALQKEIDVLNSEISNLERERLQGLREVDAVFVDRFYKANAASILRYGDAQLTTWLTSQLSGDNLSEYEERRSAIEQRNSGKLSNKENERNSKQKEKAKLKQKKIANLINRENIDEIFSVVSKNSLDEITTYEEVKRNQYFDLLKYLIRNAYIDETYADYMTYFYPNSLSTVDKIFLQSVTNKAAKEYSYELKDPALVFSKLNVFDFDEEETLNFSLLTYLLSPGLPKDCLSHLIAQLEKQEKFDFISQYLAVTPVKEKIVICINALWPGFFGQALERRALPAQQLWEYSHDTLFYSSEDDIRSVNEKGLLAKYISSRDDYLNVLSENHAALMYGLILLNVKFQAIDYTKSDHNLFMQVYEQSCYVLNYDNIALMLMIAYGIGDEADIRHRNYWAITSKKDAPLCKYVQQEIGTYADIMLMFCDDNIQDYEPAAIEFLNHTGVSLEQKLKYISKLCTEITALKNIKDPTLWTDLLNTGLVVFSENNLMDYWLNARKFDTALIGFINEADQRINLKAIQQNCDEDTRKDLFGQIVVCTELANEQYIDMLTSLEFQYIKGFSIADIPNDKLLLLIDAGIIRMSQDALKFIRSNYPTVCYQFIRKNLNDFVSIMTPQLIVHDEVIEIISWEVGDETKLSLLKHANSPISVVNKGYSPSVTLYILQNRLDPNDMQTLCVQYPKLEDAIKNIVLSYAERKIESIINSSLNSSDNLKLKMMGSPNVSESNKYKLLSVMLARVNKQWGTACFEHLRLSEFVKIFDSHAKPKIPKNDQSKRILDVLVAREWIYDYPDYPYDSNYYTVRRNAPTKKRELTKV